MNGFHRFDRRRHSLDVKQDYVGINLIFGQLDKFHGRGVVLGVCRGKHLLKKFNPGNNLAFAIVVQHSDHRIRRTVDKYQAANANVIGGSDTRLPPHTRARPPKSTISSARSTVS